MLKTKHTLASFIIRWFETYNLVKIVFTISRSVVYYQVKCVVHILILNIILKSLEVMIVNS